MLGFVASICMGLSGSGLGLQFRFYILTSVLIGAAHVMTLRAFRVEEEELALTPFCLAYATSFILFAYICREFDRFVLLLWFCTTTSLTNQPLCFVPLVTQQLPLLLSPRAKANGTKPRRAA
jgi:hypothetical protein